MITEVQWRNTEVAQTSLHYTHKHKDIFNIELSKTIWQIKLVL